MYKQFYSNLPAYGLLMYSLNKSVYDIKIVRITKSFVNFDVIVFEIISHSYLTVRRG